MATISQFWIDYCSGAYQLSLTFQIRDIIEEIQHDAIQHGLGGSPPYLTKLRRIIGEDDADNKG